MAMILVNVLAAVCFLFLEFTEVSSGGEATSVFGVVFTRWGHNDCPALTTKVYNGVMAGSRHNNSGDGYKYLCLPPVPMYDEVEVEPGMQTDRGYIHHTQYYTPSGPFESKQYQDVPCAVCLDGRHSNVILHPARNNCPTGWAVEYHGYLMVLKRPGHGVCLR
ncbi:short-chain collagen C4-like [Ptychodera flava]|uniref:short-chain collagen C4-like n=1 Tax=Ptychodera flava TaxID=63121 RepID=UPI00396AAE18